MYRRRPREFKARFTFILPEEYRRLFDAKKPKLGNIKIEFNGNGSGAAKDVDCQVPQKPERKPAALQGKDRFLWGKEDVELAVKWFKRLIRKEAVRIDGKEYYARLENVMEVVERAFGSTLP